MARRALVDSNVLPDAFTDDPPWADWSAERLAKAFDDGPVAVDLLLLAELSVGFERIEDPDAALPQLIEREDLPRGAAFLAGRCYLRYRRRGGTRRSPLPDFHIAAHGGTTGRVLLTRDRPRHLDLLPASTSSPLTERF